MFTSLSDSLLSLAYPQICLLCKNSVEKYADGMACSDCWDQTRIFNGSEWLCRKCGKYLGDSARGSETFCNKCHDHFYDIACSVGIYEKALAASVVALKKQQHLPGRFKSCFLSALTAADFEQATVIMPVPLSRKRFHERGFNQAELLAEGAARSIEIRLDKTSLVRTTHTPMHRAAMDSKAREKTVANAFEIVRPRGIRGEGVLLIDDVLTSGSTASACARILKENGAAWVGVFTLARAV